MTKRLECSAMAWETWVQSQVESYQRLKKKWYLMAPCLTLSIIRYGSRVKWSNPGKGVAPSPTPWCSKQSKGERSSHPRLWSPTLLTLFTKYSLTRYIGIIHIFTHVHTHTHTHTHIYIYIYIYISWSMYWWSF